MFFSKRASNKQKTTELSAEVEQLRAENEELRAQLERVERELAATRPVASAAEWFVDLLNYENGHVKQGLVDIQGDLAGSIDGAKSTLDCVDGLQSDFAEVSDHIDHVVSNLEGLDQLSQGSHNSVSSLSERAGEISSNSMK